MAENPAPIFLNYNRTPRSAWKRRSIRILLVLILIGVLIHWGPLVDRVIQQEIALRRYLAAQEAALNYLEPETQIICSDDPVVAQNFRAVPFFSRAKQNDVLSPTLMPWGLMFSEPTNNQIGPNLFIHYRRSPAGHERLVHILTSGDIYLCPQVIIPGTKAIPPKVINSNQFFQLQHRTEDQPLTLFAGQPDPVDLSHFTISMLFRGVHYPIDCYLRDDDSILFNPHLGYQLTTSSGNGGEMFAIDLYASTVVPVTTPLLQLGTRRRLSINNDVPHFFRAAFSPDDKLLAVSSAWNLGGLRLIDAVTGQTVRTLSVRLANPPTRLEFSPDGSRLAEVDDWGNMGVWDVATGASVSQTSRKDSDTAFAEFRGKSATTLPASFAWLNGQTEVVHPDALTPPARCFPVDENGQQSSYSFSAEARYLACLSSYRDSICVLNLASHRSILNRAICESNNIPVTRTYSSVTFSPGDRFLVARCVEHGLCLWTMPDGKTLFDLTTQGDILSFSFSADGKRLVTLGMDDSLCVWDLDSLKK